MHRRALQLVSVTALAFLFHASGGRAQFLGPVETTNSQQPAGTALPADFRGRITYQGNFSGRRTEPGRAPRRPDLRSLINSGGQSREFAGSTTIEVEYEGNVVRATYVADGVRSGFTGTRSETSCRVIDTRDGGVGTLRCDRNTLSGTFESAPGARATYRTTVETHATRFVDAAQEERQREVAAAAAAAERQQRVAESERRRADLEAFLRNRPRASTAQASVLARSVEQDATNWVGNRYDRRSLTDVRMVDSSNGQVIVRATYTFNGGSPGWVAARLVNQQVQCLQYWDTGVCVAPRRAYFAELAGANERAPAQRLPSLWDIFSNMFPVFDAPRISLRQMECDSEYAYGLRAQGTCD